MATTTFSLGTASSGTAGSGTITGDGAGNVTGSGTHFLTDLVDGSGNYLTFIVSGAVYTINNILSDTSLAVTNATPSFSGASYTIGLRNIASLLDFCSRMITATTTFSYVANLYNDSEYIEPTWLHLTPGLTGGNTITIQAAPGQSFRDQANAHSNALAYNRSNGVAIHCFDPSHTGLEVSTTTPVTINGLQFRQTTPGQGVLQGDGNSVLSINDCLLVGAAPIVGTHTTIVVTNSILQSSEATSIYVDNGSVTCYFCDLVNSTGAGGEHVALGSGGSVALENCALFGAAALTTGGTTTYTNCVTDLTGTTGLVGGKTYARQFVNNATPDWRQNSGSDLYGAGVQDLTNGLVDILGFTRKNPPDVGAHELPVGVTITHHWNLGVNV